MARQLTEGDCTALYKQLKLTQQQIDAFEAIYTRAKTTIPKVEMLKIYKEYNFGAEQLEEHIRQYEAKLRQPEPPKVEKHIGCNVKMPERINCNTPMKVSYEIFPDGSIRGFSIDIVPTSQ